MTTPNLSEPWWVSRDEEAEAEDAPVLEVPCPCCYSNGHEGLCPFEVDLTTARLAVLLGRPLPKPFASPAAVMSHIINGHAQEEVPTVECVYCRDTSVVASDE